MFQFTNKGVFKLPKNLDFEFLSLKENLICINTKKYCDFVICHLKNLRQKMQLLRKNVVIG